MPIKIEGNWKNGFAYDFHTLSSTYLGPNQFGHDSFDNTRSEMGELVYKLKYGSNRSVIKKIIELIDGLVDDLGKFDVIVPIPSSKKNRPFQPVEEIAKEIGKRRGIAVLDSVVTRY